MSDVEGLPRTGELGLQIMSRSAIRDTYRFAAFESDGKLIIASQPFKSGVIASSGGRREKQIFQAIVAELAVLGWQAIPTGPKWFDHRLYFVGTANLLAPAPMGMPMPMITQVQAPQRGLSPGVMWGWSVAIILLLFVFCVVLAFSTEIRLTPVAP